MSEDYKNHGHPPGWENEHDPRCQACAQSELASSGCSGSAAVRDLERHHAAWVKHFVKPVARFMRERGISEVRIKIGKDGKASYLLEPDAEWIGDSIQNVKVQPRKAGE
jgi:hypothetical protein